MSKRTFEELQEALKRATMPDGADVIAQCIAELEELDSPEARALCAGTYGNRYLFTGDYGLALEQFQHALDIYSQLGLGKQAAVTRANLGISHFRIGDYSTALECYTSALSYHQQFGDRSDVARLEANIGVAHEVNGNLSEALDHLQRALHIRKELGVPYGEARVIGNIGNVYYASGNYPLALECYYKALDLHEAHGNRVERANILGNIGAIRKATGDYALALESYHQVLAIFKEYGHRGGIASSTSNIGNVYTHLGDDVTGLVYLRQALVMHEENGDREGVALVMGNIFGALVRIKSYEEAYTILEQLDAMSIISPNTAIVREVNRALLHVAHNEYVQAEKSYRVALELSINHELPNKQIDVHAYLRELCQTTNDFPGYIEHNNEYTRIVEETNGKETATKLAMQEKQREIDAREKEHQKHMAVLHSTLPKHIADRVARGEEVNDSFDNAAVLFLDVVGFTTHSAELDAGVVVALLQNIFTTFDAISAENNVMKIKTIGDSYMAVAFGTANTEQRIANAAVAMMSTMFTWPHTGERVKFRIGLHCGPVVAGVLGTERMQYDVWGDTVNVASRMESTSEPGRIHVSEAFATLLPVTSASDSFERPLQLLERGTIEIKGKGLMKTYWLAENSEQ
ncbi:MAG: tetratricopeptide repeat protein [Ignavibacteria bacterium]|nr:tetratricopeptide repeat protein [Ignavibacteria bacterium]